jgi:predicted nuclease with TOPRIM domain
MGRVSQQQRNQIESRIRAATDRLLRGDIPNGGGCDVKTLAEEAGVTRAALYSTYLHLKEEFEARRERQRSTGIDNDQRQRQIERLKDEVAKLRQRLAQRDADIAAGKKFRQTAVSRLAAQHDEIVRLRSALANHAHIRDLPRRSSS